MNIQLNVNDNLEIESPIIFDDSGELILEITKQDTDFTSGDYDFLFQTCYFILSNTQLTFNDGVLSGTVDLNFLETQFDLARKNRIALEVVLNKDGLEIGRGIATCKREKIPDYVSVPVNGTAIEYTQNQTVKVDPTTKELTTPTEFFSANANDIYNAIENLIEIPDAVIDHTNLENIGTNTHAQIDTALTRLENTSGTNTGDEDLSGYVLQSEIDSDLTRLANTSGTNTGDQDLSGYLSTAGLASELTPYAKLDASNQPFTGDITVSKSNPKLIVSDSGLSSTAYLEKMTTLDGKQLVSQNRLYMIGGGLTMISDYFTGTYAQPNLTLSGAFTISFWYRPAENAQAQLGGSTGNGLYLNSSGLHQVRIASGTNRRWNMPSWPLSTWKHYVVTRNSDGSVFNLYIDGVAATLEQAGTNLGSNFALTYLFAGANSGGSGGTYDEIIIKQSLSSQADVDTLYNSGSPTEQSNTGMLRYYKLNTTSGTTVIDSSINAANLSLLKNGGGASATHSWVTGIVNSGVQALSNIPVLKIINNSTNLSYGTLTHGYYNSIYGLANIYEGTSHQFNALGTSKMSISASGVSIPTITGSTATASISATGTITATSTITGGGAVIVGTNLTTGAGLVSGPSHSFTSDSDTGMYSGGANIIKFATAGTERASIIADGKMAIGAITPTALLDINSDTIRLRTAKTPASATATGNAGDICWDADYIYICVATNTWKRSAITTW